jgi:hypothetical protein
LLVLKPSGNRSRRKSNTGRQSSRNWRLFCTDTRWPVDYYRGDHVQLDDPNWHSFTFSRYDRSTGQLAMREGAGLSQHRLMQCRTAFWYVSIDELNAGTGLPERCCARAEVL